jgi:hypothetical protein
VRHVDSSPRPDLLAALAFLATGCGVGSEKAAATTTEVTVPATTEAATTEAATPDAATIAKLQKLATEIDQKKLTAASTHISASVQKNCNG